METPTSPRFAPAGPGNRDRNRDVWPAPRNRVRVEWCSRCSRRAGKSRSTPSTSPPAPRWFLARSLLSKSDHVPAGPTSLAQLCEKTMKMAIRPLGSEGSDPRFSEGGAGNSCAWCPAATGSLDAEPTEVRMSAAAKITFVLVLVALGCGGRSVSFRLTADAGPDCSTASCAPALCGESCTSPCGCCSCIPGERGEDLICTDRGCYAPAAAPDAGMLAACGSQGDPACGQGSSCVVGCPFQGGGGLCRIAGREMCGCGAADQPCTTPGFECLYPSCCDYEGLCLTPDERQTVCSGPLAAKFDCARQIGSTDAGSDVFFAAACALPFDPGPCEAVVAAYAFVGGSCVARTWGGCAGNANRFSTLEECMATCEGRPVPLGCPPGRTAQRICVSSDATSGCRSIMACATPCDPASPTCAFPLSDCFNGVCQAFPPD